MRSYLVHALIVTGAEVIEDGALVVADDAIGAVAPSAAPAGAIIDLGGDWLLPGLVDLHCDALEKDIEPRPNVHVPLKFAIATADKRNAAADITTPFHALSFASAEFGVRNVHMAAEAARAVQAFRPYGLVDNRVHCLYEIADPAGFPVLYALIGRGDLDLLSFMDHTPGQALARAIRTNRAALAERLSFRRRLNRQHERDSRNAAARLFLKDTGTAFRDGAIAIPTRAPCP